MIVSAVLSLGIPPAGAALPMEQGTVPAAKEETLLLDQVQVMGTFPKELIDELGPAHTMQAVIDILDRRGLSYERAKIAIATKDIPPAIVVEINRLPPGEPFIIPVGDLMTVNVVVGHAPPARR